MEKQKSTSKLEETVKGKKRECVKKKIKFWPNPAKGSEGQINHNDGGRGFYFEDPSGHVLEVITRPYGSGKSAD